MFTAKYPSSRMRGFRRASLWTLTRKSSGLRETEIRAFAVMPSVRSSRPEVTTVTPVGKRRIAPLRESPLGSRSSHPCSSVPCGPSAGIFPPLHAVPNMASRLPGMMLLRKRVARAQLLGPPPLDRLPVGTIPPAEILAVVEVVEDERLRAGEQGRIHGYDPVAEQASIFDQAFVPLADPGRLLTVGRAPGHGAIPQARRLVQSAWEEFVHLGEWGEAALVGCQVRTAEGDQVRDAPVSRVAASAVGWIAADVYPTGNAADGVPDEHGLLGIALQQRPVHHARDLEDELSVAPDTPQEPVERSDRGDVHLRVRDLAQDLRETPIPPRPRRQPSDQDYRTVRHRTEYKRTPFGLPLPIRSSPLCRRGRTGLQGPPAA